MQFSPVPAPIPGRWVRIYSNQKEIEYILASNIRVAVETRPTQLQNLLCCSGKIALQS